HVARLRAPLARRPARRRGRPRRAARRRGGPRMSPLRPGVRGAVLIALKILASVALLAILFTRIPFSSVTGTLARAVPSWLAAACVVMLASNILGSWQWDQLLAAVGVRIPFWKVCAYYHVGLFFNNFLPANIGGDLARIADAARY